MKIKLTLFFNFIYIYIYISPETQTKIKHILQTFHCRQYSRLNGFGNGQFSLKSLIMSYGMICWE